jgi:hypothetical protein
VVVPDIDNGNTEEAVMHDGKHRWAMSWPGNYCVCCGQDDVIEEAICCPDCHFDYPGPNDDFSTYLPKPPVLCAEHQERANRPCPCLCGTTDAVRESGRSL